MSLSNPPRFSGFEPASLCRYGDRFKLTLRKFVADYPDLPTASDGPKVRSEDKLDQSISRARARIFELAICNPWEFFVTLTLDPARYDRRDLPAFRRDLSQWIRNQRRLHGCDFRYLLIPEMHRDGAWHMHGLVAGLRESAFEFNANGYLDYPPYRDRFGFISLSRVRVPEAVARYITKYVSKDLAARRGAVGAHLVYASRGLLGSELIDRGDFHPPAGLKPTFENDYVWVLWLDSPIELEHIPRTGRYECDV